MCRLGLVTVLSMSHPEAPRGPEASVNENSGPTNIRV